MYEPNVGAPICVKRTLTHLRREIDRPVIIAGAFNTRFSLIITTAIQKASKYRL